MRAWRSWPFSTCFQPCPLCTETFWFSFNSRLHCSWGNSHLQILCKFYSKKLSFGRTWGTSLSGCQSVVGLIIRNNALERSACTTFHTGGLFPFRLLKHSLFFSFFYTKSLLIVNFVTLLFFLFPILYLFLMPTKNNKTSQYNTYLVFELFSVNTSFNLVAND